jgi:neutral ceramidase
MPERLYAGAARRIINPPLGTRQTGFRLFGNPVQAIESDLTATALVLSDGETKVVIFGIDLSLVGIDISLYAQRPAQDMRHQIAQALGIPINHVLLNTSHTHTGVAMPEYMPDSEEQMALKEKYRRSLIRWLVEAAVEADQKLQPARIAADWGECHIGVYRREERDGHDVLGAVPDHPIDSTVGVIRVDDLEGRPIAVLFRYSCHPVTMGPRSAIASSDFPGAARQVLEGSLGGLAIFLQGCGGNINPAVGMGYELDCRDTKNRVGMTLGGEALKVAANIRTNLRPGESRPLGNVPNILFTPWVPVDEAPCTFLSVVEQAVSLDYVELPTLAEAEAIRLYWQEVVAERRRSDAHEWEVRVAEKYEDWSRVLVDAVLNGHPTCDLFIQVIRVNDIVIAGMNAELFFETGLAIREQSPFVNTFVLGYTNGTIGYLPRIDDYPPNGWRLQERYAVPDLIFQVHPQPVALREDSEGRAVAGAVRIINQLASAQKDAV